MSKFSRYRINLVTETVYNDIGYSRVAAGAVGLIKWYLPGKVLRINSTTSIKYNKMHVFVNEGEAKLIEFVVNVSENIVHCKNLIDFMKSTFWILK